MAVPSPLSSSSSPPSSLLSLFVLVVVGDGIATVTSEPRIGSMGEQYGENSGRTRSSDDGPSLDGNDVRSLNEVVCCSLHLLMLDSSLSLLLLVP